ncbi:MAG: hypothetical protein C0404_07985 [Verrucomicrobia bacterium]|nr:hypothetical protein [Verrucomicrobiota bacterium]
MIVLFAVIAGAASPALATNTTHSPEVVAVAERSAVVESPGTSTTPWWVWPLALFILTFVLGILAVLGGVGGAVLFVPVVSGFFPFHMDFVRCTGLLVALAGSLAAGPGLLRRGYAYIKLSFPMALVSSIGAIIGAIIGLELPTKVIEFALGAVILGIVVLMLVAKNAEYPQLSGPGAIAQFLQIRGVFYDQAANRKIEWTVHRVRWGLLLFFVIGVLAGMFGLGAGWANVPTFNLLMGAPLKVAAGTSKFLLSITDTAAAWVYIASGAVLPTIIIPSVLGIMLGSFIGVRLLAVTKAATVRHIVIALLLVSGVRALLKGFGI